MILVNKLFESIYNESHTNVYYEYISIPSKLVDKYSNHVFEKTPKEYHITTCFKPEFDLSEHYGTEFHFRVVAYGISGKAEAVKVELLDKPKWLSNLKDLLHVTLSFLEKPVDSNYITDWEPVSDDTVYTGTFDGKIFDKPRVTESMATSSTGIHYAKDENSFETMYPPNEEAKESIENINYHGWQKWVRERNPEPDKFHNKFAKAEKDGVYYGNCVPCIFEAN